MDDATRAQLGGAAIALLLALFASVRRRLRTGKRVLPKMRLRASFSIRTPDTDPPPGEEIEIIGPIDEERTPVMRRRRNDADDPK